MTKYKIDGATKAAYLEAFNTRDDLKQFGVDALLLFALELKFGIDDILAVASTSITEGGDDKKADLIYLNSEEGYAVIAQTYIANKTTDKNGNPKKAAPSNKASDLNTAVSWIIGISVDRVPEEIRPQTVELREAINSGNVKCIYIWYVHNLPESKNVKGELATVESTAKTLIDSNFSDHKEIEIRSLEVGIHTLETWYKSINTPILVTDKFKIPIQGGFEVIGPDWKAFITAIPATWLYQQIHVYNTDIFSADIREYLGSRKDETNINYGIKKSAQYAPSNFFVYNNGISALVHSYKHFKEKNNQYVEIKGFSIMNGAQTTGAIGALDKKPKKETLVQVRFITCRNSSRVHDIVLYNNSQNKVTGPDFRSNDKIQSRLSEEFKQIPGVEYMARRGGYQDRIKRSPNILASVTAGQALAAFHSDPDVAYHEKTKIWDDDKLYIRYFHEHTTARHIVFVYSLVMSVENRKLYLMNRIRSGNVTNQENTEFQYFHLRGSIPLMVYAISSSLEIIINKQIANKYNLIFNKNISTQDASLIWDPVVVSISSFSNSLCEGLSDGFRTREKVDKAVSIFRSLVSATKIANSPIYNTFAKRVI